MRKLLYGLASLAIAATMVGATYAGSNLTQVYPIKPCARHKGVICAGGAHQSGTITFQAAGTKTKITIALKGESASAIEPAHIHVGACKDPGAVKIPLTDVVHGNSVTIVDMPISKAAVSGTSVNVHKSPHELNAYVACGDIQFAM